MNKVAALLVMLGTCASAEAANLFVDRATGNDGNDGLSWPTARATVTSALGTAAASPEPDVISVAAGRYIEQLVVPAGTTLLGGFSSGGGARDPAANPTLLDGGQAGASVVHFPPGSDGAVLDGFIITGGEGSIGPDFVSDGGGILVEDAAPIIRGNIVEGNSAYNGAGIALIYTSARASARVEGNVIQRNRLNGPRFPCERSMAVGGGVYVRGPVGVDLGLVLAGNRIAENEACLGGGVYFEGQGAMEHDVVEGNSSGLWLVNGPVRLFNTRITENRGSGVSVTCGGAYRLDNVTLAANGVGIVTDQGSLGALDVENSISWSNSGEIGWDCSGTLPTVVSSIVQGGFPGGVGIIDADPLFAPGPLGDYYLSQVASGQSATSPAVDAGSQTSLAVGLDQRTTATDSAPDAGTVDLGYHPPRILTLTVLRGIVATTLTPHRTIAALPFTDDPGTLSDPALPLLFYAIAGSDNEIGVTKDTAADAVRIDFR